MTGINSTNNRLSQYLFTQSTNMKKLTLILLVVTAISCNKILGKTCWDCEVTRRDGTTYKEKACRDDDNVPQFMDNLGNDLNSYCTRR